MKLTGATVTCRGEWVAADCHGNNAAVGCPACGQRPILLVARPSQRGSDSGHAATCHGCNARVWIATPVTDGGEAGTIAIDFESA